MEAGEKEAGGRAAIKLLFSSLRFPTRIPAPAQQSSKCVHVLQRASLRGEDKILRRQSPGHIQYLNFEGS